jgi:hypothetical protein
MKMRAWSVDAEQYLAKTLNDYRVGSLRELPKHIRTEVMRKADRIAKDHVYGPGLDKFAGIGTEDNITAACVEAYITEQTKRREVPEPGYEEHLAWLRQRLEICNARRRAEAKVEEDELEALP